MFANFATAITSSTAVTLALFYLMNLLIHIQPQATVDPGERHPVIWDQGKIDDTPPKTIEKKITREFVDPPRPPRTEPSGERETVRITRPKTTPPPVLQLQETGPILHDGPPMALVRVSPTYPARAQQAGLEGWVLVRFDVLPNGAVTNVSVVESSNRVFEASARRAAERFRYKARVVDGVPQMTYGVQNLFRFRMED